MVCEHQKPPMVGGFVQSRIPRGKYDARGQNLPRFPRYLYQHYSTFLSVKTRKRANDSLEYVPVLREHLCCKHMVPLGAFVEGHAD